MASINPSNFEKIFLAQILVNIRGSVMKWKVRVVQYSEPIIVEAETMQEAQEFVAEQTVWEPENVYFETKQVESDKDKKIKALFATDNAQLLAGS